MAQHGKYLYRIVKAKNQIWTKYVQIKFWKVNQGKGIDTEQEWPRCQSTWDY